MRGKRVVRTASIHAIFLDPRTFISQKQGEGRWGWGVGVNGHAHRYVLILLAKRVFFSFGVKTSLGEDSSLQPSAFGGRKCLLELPA